MTSCRTMLLTGALCLVAMAPPLAAQPADRGNPPGPGQASGLGPDETRQTSGIRSGQEDADGVPGVGRSDRAADRVGAGRGDGSTAGARSRSGAVGNLGDGSTDGAGPGRGSAVGRLGDGATDGTGPAGGGADGGFGVGSSGAVADGPGSGRGGGLGSLVTGHGG